MDAQICVCEPRPRKPFERSLFDFMSMSRGRSHRLILRYFLEQIIERGNICEQGSILVFNPEAEKLKLYDKANNINSINNFPSKDFDVNDGLAGLVFRKAEPEFVLDTAAHPEFQPVSGQDIHTIYCLPIMLDHQQEPFGVVSFHNSKAGGAINDCSRQYMHISVKTLEAMLSLAPLSQRLVPQEKVFIVHGRNKAALEELENLLKNEVIDYVVIQSLARTGQDLLSFIEERIKDCVAGFILLTADDEGRLYQFGECMRQRPRQNVIFEGGYLMALFRGTNRVCFLRQGDVEIPSDLNGLLMEHFEEHLEPERIKLTLRQWGLKGLSGAGEPKPPAR